MTRLRTEDIEHILGDLKAYDQQLLVRTGNTLKGIALHATGLSEGELLRSEALFSDSVSGTSATSAHVLAVQADPPLDLMITSSEDPVREGTALTITMTVSNPSAVDTQTNVVLQAVTPDFMQFSSAQMAPPGSCSSSLCSPGDTITWTLASLAPGETWVVRYSDTITTAADDGALLTADAMVMADGVSAVQDSHTVVVTEAAP